MASESKNCTRCQTSKSLDEFGRRAGTRDGLDYRCKECHRANDRQTYWVKRGKPQRSHFPKGDPALGVPNEVKVRARKRLNDAVLEGRVVKPAVCENCGEPTTSSELQGHHDDYNQPYAVAWLCRQCHLNRHSTPLEGQSNE